MNLAEGDKVTAAARLIGTEEEALVAEIETHEDLSIMDQSLPENDEE